MHDESHLYFHSPCFDGIVSCVLAWDFLEAKQGWLSPSLHPVNYDARETWISGRLHQKSSVVDFLYHPDACFWADHHATTFLTPKAEKDFEERMSPWLTYDPQSGSCALLLWEHLAKAFQYRNLAYEQLVQWADKIDSARYLSVEEAIFGAEPALRINLSLDLNSDPAYYEHLVRQLKLESLERVARLPEVMSRSEQADSMIRSGLKRFATCVTLDSDGIAVFDVDSSGVIISRYAPYHVFPEARYSAGIVRSPQDALITAMRNPWRESPSVPLGRIFGKFGGGGHQRVGSLVLTRNRVAEATSILNQILREIREQETSTLDTKPEFL